MQNFMELDVKKFTDPKTLTIGVWGLKTRLGQFGPKACFGRGLIKPLVKNPSSNFHKQDLFTNKTSFSQESWGESNKIMKSQRMSWPWHLEPRNYIWATWAQKTYPIQPISPEPWLQFSQTGPHFLENHEMNPIKL